MPFVHGKNTRVWLDGYDMSPYFTDVTMSAKVGMADTTTYALAAGAPVAKTVVPGIKEGTVMLKGLFDSTGPHASSYAVSGTTDGPDNYFNNLLTEDTGSGAALVPQNVDACVTISPTGSTAIGSRVIAAAGVVSSYQLQSSIKNAVMVQGELESDGGLDTGVVICDPSQSGSWVGGGTASVAAGQAIPGTGTLTTTAAPTGFPASGYLAVPTNALSGYTICKYTAISASTFTGVTALGTATTVAGSVYALNAMGQVSDVPEPNDVNGANPLTISVTAGAFGTGQTIGTTTSPIGKWPYVGQVLVPTASTPVVVNYNGLSTAGFLNSSGASGTAVAGTAYVPALGSPTGAYALMHVGNPGTVVYAALLTSDAATGTFNVIESFVGSFPLNTANLSGTYGSGQYGTGQYGSGPGAQGGYILAIPQGIDIYQNVQALVGFNGTPCPVLISFVRL